MSEDLRILLLEDVSDDAELIRRELRKAGIRFTSECVDTKRGFLEMLEGFDPSLIIADYSLGQFNALEALNLLKERGAELPFILVTGTQSEEVAVACIKKGADDYILKSSLKRLPSAVLGAIKKRATEQERERAEERIREQAALLDKAQDAILVHDFENRIAFWNKSAERLYGWRSDEVIGRRVDELLDKEDSVASEARMAALARGEWQGELQQLTRSGKQVVVESRLTRVSGPGGEPRSMLVIGTDVTERKKLESQFLRVQRMESIGTLAGGIAHDLNNVLTPILMAIRMLRDEVSSPSAHTILNTLETSAQRGSGIVQQVLSFARGVEGERSIFQVKHPLMEVVSMAKDTMPRSIHITTRIDKDLWPVLGDPTQMHQVFMNLCVNARDAMPNGGRLHVEAGNVVIDENYARMQPDAHSGRHVVVTISDSGVGIPPALLDKVFEPFFTTKEIGKGTGLGLSTVLGIVKNHGGFLNIYSEVGKGTRFKIHLPAAQAMGDGERVEPEEFLPNGHGELILVTDDEFAIRDIIRMTLEAHCYRVITANDGTEAVAIYAQYQSKIDAVIVDVMMPYMDGPATIRALQKMNPETRFLAVSGLMDNDKVNELSEHGQVAFLAKPFTTEQLLIKLHRLLNAA